jgi:hypothetical protein
MFKIRNKANSSLAFIFLSMVLILLSVWTLYRDSGEFNDALKSEIEYLKVENTFLRQSLQKFQSKEGKKIPKLAPESFENGCNVPRAEYEYTRHKVQRDVNEFWNFLRARCEKTIHEAKKSWNTEMASVFEETLKSGLHRHSVIKRDLEILVETDGYDEWRRKELKDLSDLVSNRLVALQNPVDCSSAKKLVCNLNIECGYGCQTHHAVYCLIVAYQSNRTLIFDPNQEGCVTKQ